MQSELKWTQLYSLTVKIAKLQEERCKEAEFSAFETFIYCKKFYLIIIWHFVLPELKQWLIDCLQDIQR